MTSKRHALQIADLFCGAGGAAMGIHEAMEEAELAHVIVGFDTKKQPRYPFDFVQQDAFTVDLSPFDAVWASPPCQVYSTLAHLSNSIHKGVVPAIRKTLRGAGKPYIIENVPGAPLDSPIRLCGSSFGLMTKSGAQLRRHRLFELSDPILLVPPCVHAKMTIGVFGSKARDTKEEKRHYSKDKKLRGLPPASILFTREDAENAMGIDWMTFPELSQAVPPVYSWFLWKHIIPILVSNLNLNDVI